MLRKGSIFVWTKQHENVFQLLKEELTKMLVLQFPNQYKPFQLFTDTSKHKHSRILHQKKEGQPNVDEPVLIPIMFFSGDFNKLQQLWNSAQKECYAIYKSVKNFAFYLTGTDCTLYCNHKPLTLFFATGIFSNVSDWWTLELQQFNMKF